MTTYEWAQLVLAVLGATAIVFLSQDESWRWRRLGYVFGLCSEPAWVYAAFTASPRQWGAMAAAVFFTFAWCNGIWRHWIRRKRVGSVLKQTS